MNFLQKKHHEKLNEFNDLCKQLDSNKLCKSSSCKQNKNLPGTSQTSSTKTKKKSLIQQSISFTGYQKPITQDTLDEYVSFRIYTRIR